MQTNKNVSIQIDCLLTDLNLFEPTKQFKNSTKETYNCKIIIDKKEQITIDDLTTAINDCKTIGLNGCWQPVANYPHGLKYPTKYNSKTVQIVACTFFKIIIKDIHEKPIDESIIEEIKKRGSFRAIVDLSFYPYYKNTGYGIGTNINAIYFVGFDEEPTPQQEEPKQEPKEPQQEQQQEEPKEQNEMFNIFKRQPQANKPIKTIGITALYNDDVYTFNFDLISKDASKQNDFMIVQRKNNPLELNIGIYNPNIFKFDYLQSIINLIIEKLEQNTLWMKGTPIDDLFNVGYGKLV